jgi:hypothetical protein
MERQVVGCFVDELESKLGERVLTYYEAPIGFCSGGTPRNDSEKRDLKSLNHILLSESIGN